MFIVTQALATLLLAGLFVVQVEGFGYVLEQAVRGIWRRLHHGNVLASEQPSPFVLRLFMGLVFYGTVMLFLGITGLYSPGAILAITLGVPLLGFWFGRRWRSVGKIKHTYSQCKIELWGALAFAGISFVFFHRPVFEFDSVWYHLAIPKLFLQQGSSAYVGPLPLYSLQPNLNYFWSLWPLSLPMPLPQITLVINAIQLSIVTLGLFFAARVGRIVLGWGKAARFFSPLLIGINLQALVLFGSGYVDVVGMAFGLVSGLYVYYLTSQKAIRWEEWTAGVLLIIGLASLKIFFMLLALPLLVWFVAAGWSRLPSARRWQLLGASMLILGVIFVLPWLVRSYVYTGRILDPVGQPGLNESVYEAEGSLTAQNHWSVYIFSRFFQTWDELILSRFTPLVALGVAGIIYGAWRRRVVWLWLAAMSGFWLAHFISIVYVPRYLLPAAGLLIWLGLGFLDEFSRRFSKWGKVALWTLAIATVAFVLEWARPHIRVKDLYVLHSQTAEAYIEERVVGNIFTYYLSASSPRPADLAGNETIFEFGVHNLFYIANPILDPRVHTSELKVGKFATAAEFAAFLKQKGIRYMLVKGPTLKSACRESGVVVFEECTAESPWWGIAVTDKLQDVVWLKLK